GTHAHDVVIPLSAKNEKALHKRLEDLQQWLTKTPTIDLNGLGYTLSCCREHFKFRNCFVVSDVENLRVQIAEALNGSSIDQRSVGDSAARLKHSYLAGEKVDWPAYYTQRKVIRAPHYPFSNQEYWSEALNFEQPRSERPTVAAQKPALQTETNAIETVFLEPQW